MYFNYSVMHVMIIRLLYYPNVPTLRSGICRRNSVYLFLLAVVCL